MRILRDRSGFGLMIMVMIIAISGILLAASNWFLVQEQRQTQLRIDRTKAHYLAQAGVMRAIWNWYTVNTTVEGSRRKAVINTTVTGNQIFKVGTTSAGVYLQSDYAYIAPISDTGITFVKSVGSNQNKTAGGTTLAVTVPAAGVALGNFLVVFVAMDANAGAVTCADTQLNTYSVAADVTNATNVRTVVLYARVETALVSGNTITVTMPATTAKAVRVSEFAGPTHLDVTSTATGSSNAPNSGNAVTTISHSLVVGALGMEGPSGDAYTLGSGYSNATKIGTTGGVADTNVTMQPEYKIMNATGTYVGNGTNTTSARDWAAAVATFSSKAHWYTSGANRRLRAWRVQNVNSTAGNNITVTDIKVSWTGGGAAQLTEIRLNNSSVWTGTNATGATANITDTALAGNGATWGSPTTYLQWNNGGPADPTTVTCQFIFSGDSTTTDAKTNEIVLWNGAHAGAGLPTQRTFVVTASGQVNQNAAAGAADSFKVLKGVKAVVSGAPALNAMEITDWDEEDKNIP